jgi:hypothetical protein
MAEKESLADNFLEHHGVVGMKWGKHKANRTESGKSGKAPKADPGGTGKNGKVTSGDIHLARFKQQARLRKLQEAEGDFFVARTAKGQDKAEKIMRKHEKALFNNPDAKMAAKMTKAEKVGAGIVYGMAAVMTVGYIAIAAEAGRNISR